MSCSHSYVSYRQADWLQSIIQDHIKEVAAAIPSTFNQSSRNAVWMICSYFKVPLGVGGIACAAAEHYISQVMKDADESNTSTLMEDISANIHLTVLCCIQLAAKMNSRYHVINASSIRSYLRTYYEQTYSIYQITEMEKNIFSALDFYIPLRTAPEIAGLLAYALNLPINCYDLVYCMADSAEQYKLNIIQRVINYTSTCYVTRTLYRIHFSAGAVTATALYIGWCNHRRLTKLSQLTDINVFYLKNIAIAILHELDPYLPNSNNANVAGV